ncbi:chemotaxis protein CheA [Aerosakkonema funiforme]|uniref:chemotaxis protein CheA n=1 Tax=Aerosakkonema funiforme TaxID=1246630 RepID=UPI0035B7F01B
MDEDIKAFLADNYENLGHIERDLVDLEQNPTDKDLLVRIYRSLHTIKGNCGFMAFGKLEALTHAGENLLSRVRDEELILNIEIINTLLQLVDTIHQSCICINATGQESDSDYSELIQRLNDLQHTAYEDKHLIIALNSENVADSLSTPSSVPSNYTQIPDLTKPSIYDKWVKNGKVNSEEAPTPLAAAQTVPSIRVDINLLDKLINLVGELVLVRNQILQFNSIQDEAGFEAASQQLNRVTSELQEAVMKTRMQPISTIWSKFPRAIRDMAIASGKQVQVEIEGEDTELDKTIIEAIKDPLTHIIRNCVDHGIEMPDVRKLSGKPESGQVRLYAFHESGYVNIEIIDDGAGIDPERLKNKALTLGLITGEQFNRLSDSEAINLIFLPGFSTADEVTRLSGRGIGMDVVKTNIEKVGGVVQISSQRKLGTVFKLKIPLTLAIIPALIVTSAGDRYAIPQMSLAELVRLEGEQAKRGIEYIHKTPVYRLRGKLLPLVYLNRELQLENQEQKSNLQSLDEVVNIVVVQANTHFGLVVDSIDDTQEIVVKPLGKLLKDTPAFAGATILGDGRVALILDVRSIAQRSGVFSEAQTKARLEQEGVSEQQTDDGREMLLLFEGLPKSRMAIPLSMVLRLEEIPITAVEKVGDLTIVQYCDRILPLIDLASVFSPQRLSCTKKKGATTRTNNSNSSLLENQLLQMIVVSCSNGQTVALAVSHILDIVMEKLTFTAATSRPGVNAIAVIKGQVTEILDLAAVTQWISN